MKRILSLSLGEVVLKGANRRYFIRRIIQNIESSLSDVGYKAIESEMGKIQVEIDPAVEETAINRLRFVFGIVYISPSWAFEKDWDRLKEETVNYIDRLLKEQPEYKTFKVVAKRSDKAFFKNSQEINMDLGGVILDHFADRLAVDVHEPDFYLYVDVKNEMYLYHKKIPTYGGLPLGTNGKGLLLLSGGIDSPVAGFLMAKRGVQVDALHFHSYPFTSPQAEEKVMNLARILARYVVKMNVYSVNLLPIQKELNKHCPPEEMTVLSRRFMMRIANRVAERIGAGCIVTGECLGQVASQTMEAMRSTEDACDYPVFRPLVGMDKEEIVSISRKIGTFGTSILPYEDCCTVFTPRHPKTHPNLSEVREAEAALPISELVERALAGEEKLKLSW